MNDLVEPVAKLKAKIKQLIALHDQLKKDYDDLKVEKELLEEEIRDQKQNENKSEELTTIISDSKTKIDELVQEIDDCISLLK